MKKFLVILILIFTLQLPSQADDIRDFQIEGMKIGDSLLDYFSEKEIMANNRNYSEKKTFFYVVSSGNLDLKDYDSFDIYLKTNERKYNIYALSGAIYNLNFEKCIKKKDEIVKEISSLFQNSKFVDYGTYPHVFDKSGLSTQTSSTLSLSSGGNVRVECYKWSEEIKLKHNWLDNLSIAVVSQEVEDWIKGGYK